MSMELRCPGCREDITEWLVATKPVYVAGDEFVIEEPNQLSGIGACPKCRFVFRSDAATYIRGVTEADIRGLHPMTRKVLADVMRGVKLNSDNKREVLAQYGKVRA